MIPYIQTQQGLTFIIDGRPKTIPVSSSNFIRISQALADPTKQDVEVETLVRSDNDILTLAVQKSGLEGLVVDGDNVTFDGEGVPAFVQQRIVDMAKDGLPLQPIVNFLTLLKDNPSYRVVQRLFEFLDHGRMPLTEDGHFLAYKAVRANWTDIHSSSIFNGIGATPSVPRNKVDEDQNRTCSYGLHLCSFDYLPQFSHADGHVVVCKVNPADVVAIPTDYHNTKMRVCAYEVISAVPNYYNERKNVLDDSWLYGADGSDDLAYEAPYRDELGLPDKWEIRAYRRRQDFVDGNAAWRETFTSEQEDEAEETFADNLSSYYALQFVNVDTDDIVRFYRDENLA